MSNKIILSMLVFLVLLVNACTQTTIAPVKEIPQEPAKVDVIGETKKTEVTEIEEEVEEIKEQASDEGEKISSEVEELLSIADKKVESLKYRYKGPETKDFFYNFFVKGNKIKYTLSPTHLIDVDEDAYDTIYINKEFKTALAYCDHQKCYRKGKKAVLNYNEAYILTPLEWLDNIKNAEKAGEEVLEQRNTWKLSTDNFTVWVETFFGVPVQVEYEGSLYKFQKMSFNAVKDEDVTPKD